MCYLQEKNHSLYLRDQLEFPLVSIIIRVATPSIISLSLIRILAKSSAYNIAFMVILAGDMIININSFD